MRRLVFDEMARLVTETQTRPVTRFDGEGQRAQAVYLTGSIVAFPLGHSEPSLTPVRHAVSSPAHSGCGTCIAVSVKEVILGIPARSAIKDVRLPDCSA